MLGIEVAAGRLRAVVRRGRRQLETFEVPLTSDSPDAAVIELEAQVGDVQGITLTIGLAHLHVKQVKLPPVPHAARRQMLLVEPERWFVMPTGAPAAIALDRDGVIALAADGAFVESWVTACARWAPVQRVEAAPMSVARAFVTHGLRTSATVLEAAAGETGVLAVENGVLRTVRRVRAADLDPAALSVASVPEVAPAFLAAYGAALPLDHTLETMLLTPTIERRFVAAQRRRVIGWSAAAVAAVCTAVWSLGVSREQMLRALESDVASARGRAAPASASVTRALSIDQEIQAISTTTASRADALRALAALGARLPAEAVAQRVRMVGSEWQVEGNAATASAVLAALAAEPHFDRVRFLAPSNRFRDGTEDRETFAIAFAVR